MALLISVESSDHTLKMRVCVHVGGRHRKFELDFPGACEAGWESVPKEQGHVVRLSVLLSVDCFVNARVWRFVPRAKDLDHSFSLQIPKFCTGCRVLLNVAGQPESPICFRFETGGKQKSFPPRPRECPGKDLGQHAS